MGVQGPVAVALAMLLGTLDELLCNIALIQLKGSGHWRHFARWDWSQGHFAGQGTNTMETPSSS